jgi:hypothetical protein
MPLSSGAFQTAKVLQQFYRLILDIMHCSGNLKIKSIPRGKASQKTV